VYMWKSQKIVETIEKTKSAIKICSQGGLSQLVRTAHGKVKGETKMYCVKKREYKKTEKKLRSGEKTPVI